MAPPSRRPAGPPERPGGVFAVPRLAVPRELAFPFRQDVRIPIGGWKEIAPVILATFGALGYESMTPPGPTGRGSGPLRIIGERNRHLTPMLRPVKFSIYVLFGAALTLGAFDTIAVGTPLIIVPWLVGAAAFAGVFWYGFGRSCESDVVVVVWKEGTPPGTPYTPSSSSVPAVVWVGGRVRSDLRGHSRTAVHTYAVPELAGDLARTVRAFTQHLAGATSN